MRKVLKFPSPAGRPYICSSDKNKIVEQETNCSRQNVTVSQRQGRSDAAEAVNICPLGTAGS